MAKTFECEHCEGTGRVSGFFYKGSPQWNDAVAMYIFHGGVVRSDTQKLEVWFNCGTCHGDGDVTV